MTLHFPSPHLLLTFLSLSPSFSSTLRQKYLSNPPPKLYYNSQNHWKAPNDHDHASAIFWGGVRTKFMRTSHYQTETPPLMLQQAKSGVSQPENPLASLALPSDYLFLHLSLPLSSSLSLATNLLSSSALSPLTALLPSRSLSVSLSLALPCPLAVYLRPPSFFLPFLSLSKSSPECLADWAVWALIFWLNSKVTPKWSQSYNK